MLKNVFMVRIADSDDMEEINEYFDSNKKVAKMFFQIDREEFLSTLSDIDKKIPLRLKTLVLLVNMQQVHDEYLDSLTSEVIKNLI